ncbi:kinesin-like protein subito [Drosophila tropicalis]|uniref:kinesin-like protein subito n=1 Tax=Drosophila tropicalis TaxID=46794 RepID=UPI0035ABCC80
MEMDNPNPNEEKKREGRSFLMAREPSVDRRFRPRPEKQQRLFDEIRESEESNSTEDDLTDTESEYEASSTATAENPSDAESGPQVFLRLRPVKMSCKGYLISDCGNVLVTMNANTENTSNNVNRMEKHFSFTTIFDSEVGQRDVYDTCVGPRIMDEECATIMTYGTSGSGKTYTLLGDDVRAGIVPRALEHIFSMYSANIYHIPKLKVINECVVFLEDDATLMEQQTRIRLLDICPEYTHHDRIRQVIRGDHSFKPLEGNDYSVMVWVSFVEIYNELVYDLLALPPRKAKLSNVQRTNLKIVGSNGKVFVKGLTRVFVKSAEEALKLLQLGQQRSTCASTAINAKSSRSHCIFTIDVLKYHRSGMTTQNTYKFCDLAGSERVDKTGTIGSRLREAQNINTSLMVLGRCLDAAAMPSNKKTNIPYRDSKLTMLLQASLLGKERLAMIVTVTPLDKFYEENLNVLNFASIAKDIVFKQPKKKFHSTRYSGFIDASVGVISQEREYIKSLEEENLNLRLANEQLKHDKLLQLQLQEERLRKELHDAYQEMLAKSLKLAKEQNEKKLANIRREHEANIAHLNRIHAEKIEDLQEEIDELRDGNSDIEIIDDEDED